MRYLLPVFGCLLLLGIVSCKAPQATETSPVVTQAIPVPQGEVLLGEEGREFIGSTQPDPRAGYYFKLMLAGPMVGQDTFRQAREEGDKVIYHSATDVNEIAINLEASSARLYIGLGFDGMQKGDFRFGAGTPYPSMKVSLNSRMGQADGRAESGYLSISRYQERTGFVLGKLMAIVRLNGQVHQLSGSFLLPLQTE